MRSMRVSKCKFNVIALAAVLTLVGTTSFLQAQVGSAPVDGEIEGLFLDDPNDPWSSGSIVLANQTIILPRNLLLDLPANRLTLWQLFENAPPDCLAAGESGLTLRDSCRRGRGAGFGHVLANQMPDGTLVAGEVFIQKGMEVYTGVVTYIDHTDGYLRCNGNPADPANTGTMIRINDPDSVQTIQQGLGCDGGPNCSPDPRFTNDPSNYTVSFMTGYPACIPSTVGGGDRDSVSDANGVGDQFCPDSNRGNLIANDSRYMAPIQVGDHIACEGNSEIVRDRNSGALVPFFSCHSLSVSRAMHTRDDPNQPDYMLFDEVEWDAPGFQNERAKALFIAFTTLPASEFNVYALDNDPETGEEHERIIASTIGNLGAQNHGIGPGGRNIGKTGYDVDFSLGTPINPHVSPCQQLRVSGFDVCSLFPTIEEEFAILSPLTREARGRTRHKMSLNPDVISFDIQGGESQNGEYLTPIGIGHPEFDEINLDAMATPHIFVGEPWLLDRRLGPGGHCEDTEPGCDSTAILGTHRLKPFPLSELDALGQILTFQPANLEKVFSHYPFGPGDNLQALAESLTIAQDDVMTPGFERGPDLIDACSQLNNDPSAAVDLLSTNRDVALQISKEDLLANDSDPDMDQLTVTQIGSPGAGNGTITDNGNGTWTYMPAAGFTGTVQTTYAVADAHGGSAVGVLNIVVEAP